MFAGEGVGVRLMDDGTIVVKIAFSRDDVTPAKPLFTTEFRGKTKADIKAQVDVVLAKLKTAETDVTLNQQFVGQVISSI